MRVSMKLGILHFAEVNLTMPSDFVGPPLCRVIAEVST